MSRNATILFAVALFAGLVGIAGITGALIGIAKTLFFIFIVLIVVSLVYRRRRNYQREPVRQRGGVNMRNLLAPIFRLFKRDPLPFIPIRSLTLPIETQRALPGQHQTFSPRQVRRAIDSSEQTNQLPS